MQRVRQKAGGLVDHTLDAAAGCIEFLGQPDMGTGNRAAKLFGVAQNALAFLGNIGQKRAQPDLGVRIGALQVQDLVLHHAFKLSGPRQGAFHPVAHGSNLAADGTAHRADGVGSNRFRLHQPDGRLRHRACRLAHFLGAAQQRRIGPHHHHRNDRQTGIDIGFRVAQSGKQGRFGGKKPRLVGPHVIPQQRQPKGRTQCGDDERQTRRLLLQAVDQFRYRVAGFVIGGDEIGICRTLPVARLVADGKAGRGSGSLLFRRCVGASA